MDRSKWEYKKLGEVAKFINGDRGVNYPSQSDFVEFGVPFVNAGHLKNNAIDYSSMNYIAREKFDKLGSGKIQKGDLLFCLRGSPLVRIVFWIYLLNPLRGEVEG
jgi:Type I restriction modification DNA specificity domain.